MTPNAIQNSSKECLEKFKLPKVKWKSLPLKLTVSPGRPDPNGVNKIGL